jgi:rhodanese-related sulfurtransferase/biotin operon repressor
LNKQKNVVPFHSTKLLNVISEIPTNTVKTRDFKTSLYNEMASVTKALGNPHRLEILDLLAQGPASVEYIAANTTLSIANASQHLQVLKSAGLTKTERQGKYIFYRMSNDEVFQTWCALRRLGFSQNSEINSLLSDYRRKKGTLQAISTDQLIDKMKRDEVILLDVRPEEEYKKGHINKARSFPGKDLVARMDELPKEKEIVAYCRGPLCLMADESVELLNKNGFRASRLDKGYAEWMDAQKAETSQH